MARLAGERGVRKHDVVLALDLPSVLQRIPGPSPKICAHAMCRDPELGYTPRVLPTTHPRRTSWTPLASPGSGPSWLPMWTVARWRSLPAVGAAFRTASAASSKSPVPQHGSSTLSPGRGYHQASHQHANAAGCEEFPLQRSFDCGEPFQNKVLNSSASEGCGRERDAAEPVAAFSPSSIAATTAARRCDHHR